METQIKEVAAKELRVVVYRDGSEKVNLTFPVYTLNILESIIPDAIVKKINKLEFNLKDKIQDIKDKGLRPQTIFEMANEDRSYKIWIE